MEKASDRTMVNMERWGEEEKTDDETDLFRWDFSAPNDPSQRSTKNGHHV